MDANTINLIISLISGIVGGNVAGSALPADKNLGTVGNSVTGLLGGGIGGWILKILGVLGAAATAVQGGHAAAPGAIDLASILANIGGSGVGGAILTALVGYLKNSMSKSA